VGVISNFETSNPAFSCLDGESIYVWTAPAQFPGLYVVHNGDEGSQCTYGTWTFPQPSYYTVTLAAWIPQSTIDGAPPLPWAAYAALGLSCWTPPWWALLLGPVVEYIVGNGDGHTGYAGSDRASVSATLGWDGSAITSLSTSNYVATSTVTAYYYGLFGTHSCTVYKAGTQLSPTPVQTGANTFTLQVEARNNVAPPGLNPALDGAIGVSVSGNTPGHATFSFSGDTELFPSYGVGVTGPLGSGSTTLFDASGWGNPITYEEVALLLTTCCVAVSGQVGV
jgi:hypothetical protein